MTKFQKQMLTIAAAGALTAVTALPAMAFESQFNGSFLVKSYLGNWDRGTGSSAVPTADKTKTNNVTDQRTRLTYTGKASDDLKLVVQLEMNTRWGNSATGGGTNTSGMGGGIDTDGLNVATRWAYLDFNMGKSFNMKVGQQPYKDALKGLLIDADLPMALATYKAGAYQLRLGYSRFNESIQASGLTGNSFSGDTASDLYLIENSYSINKGTKVGLAYYLNVDNNKDTGVGGPVKGQDKKVNTLGLSYETQMGNLNLSGMAAMQMGYQKNLTAAPGTNFHGWAANTVAKMKVGTGLARAGFLFTSGNNRNDNAHYYGWQSVSASGNYATAGQNSYTDSGMMLLVRNQSMGGTNTDGYFRKPITNIALAHMGYDANLTEKLYLNGNVGFAWLPASDYLNTNGGVARVVARNASDFAGTELNLETGYKLYKNMTLKAQAAYWMLGSAFKNTATKTNGTAADPANPWTMRLAAQYTF